MLTVKQLAEVLGFHRATIARWAKEGRIPSLRAQRAYRFDLHDVREALSKLSNAE
jgi:excisionase family DNA binding protein